MLTLLEWVLEGDPVRSRNDGRWVRLKSLVEKRRIMCDTPKISIGAKHVALIIKATNLMRPNLHARLLDLTSRACLSKGLASRGPTAGDCLDIFYSSKLFKARRFAPVETPYSSPGPNKVGSLWCLPKNKPSDPRLYNREKVHVVDGGVGLIVLGLGTTFNKRRLQHSLSQFSFLPQGRHSACIPMHSPRNECFHATI